MKMKMIKRLLREEEGQGLVEYAILIGIITLGVIIAVQYIGGWVANQLGGLQSELESA